VVMSGFRTRKERLWIYRGLCLLTFGMVYLLLRWLPRWRLKFLAEPVPLSEAHWVVVEVLLLPSVTIVDVHRINIPSYLLIGFDLHCMVFHCQAVLPHRQTRKQRTIPFLKRFDTSITDIF